MSDPGDGLVDIDARLQERLEERDAERRRRASPAVKQDPDRRRELESLRLARTSLLEQAASAQNPVRKQQITLALAEIEKRLADLS